MLAGPWVELSGERRLPKHFNLYLQARGVQQSLPLLWQCSSVHWLSRACLAQLLPALTGLLLPVLALPAAAYNEHGWLGATVLVPYLFTLGVQIWSETWYNKRGAALPAAPSRCRGQGCPPCSTSFSSVPLQKGTLDVTRVIEP